MDFAVNLSGYPGLKAALAAKKLQEPMPTPNQIPRPRESALQHSKRRDGALRRSRRRRCLRFCVDQRRTEGGPQGCQKVVGILQQSEADPSVGGADLEFRLRVNGYEE